MPSNPTIIFRAKINKMSEPAANFFAVNNGVDEKFFTTIDGDGARFFESVRGVFVAVVREPSFDVRGVKCGE